MPLCPFKKNPHLRHLCHSSCSSIHKYCQILFDPRSLWETGLSVPPKVNRPLLDVPAVCRDPGPPPFFLFREPFLSGPLPPKLRLEGPLRPPLGRSRVIEVHHGSSWSPVLHHCSLRVAPPSPALSSCSRTTWSPPFTFNPLNHLPSSPHSTTLGFLSPSPLAPKHSYHWGLSH